MTPDFLREGTPAAVLRALPGARAVGGAVRDHLACRPIHDVDVAVPLPPEEVLRVLRAAGLKVFETGLKHGTVTAVLDHQPVEVTSLRRDVVTDGRHAEVEWTDDWHEDAARRDFTINAMSMGADGVLHDFFGGAEDLLAGRVRFVGEARQRLAEDFLRALRFFRFWARYGQGEPDAAAIAAIREAVPGLARLSVERVWMELKRLLAADDPTSALRLMAETGVLGAVLPEATPLDLVPLARLIERQAPADLVLRLCAILRRDIDQVALSQRLKISAAETKRVSDLLDQSGVPGAGEDGLRVTIWKAMTGLERAVDAEGPLWLAEALDGRDRTAERAVLTDDVFPLHGRDVLTLGMPPGPEVGELLKDTKYWWVYETGQRASREECLAKLRELANLPPA